MSEIYTDAAGNKYLGDCRWGNHDINYPTTNYLISQNQPYDAVDQQYINDFSQLLTESGWLNVTKTSTFPTDPARVAAITATAPFVGGLQLKYLKGFANSYSSNFGYGSGTSLFIEDLSTQNSFEWSSFNVSICCNQNSVGLFGWMSIPWLHFFCKLEDVNTNFGYYSNNINNQIVVISSRNTTNASAKHYIVNAQKDLLQSGRATYSISCSDGQTPGAQWATDMWVYDNNAALGYPVIGRVPNMLLGVGNYTYLKPVKIQGSVFPDNGSPWYLPVGTFAGKTLLMRCYSSMA